MPKLKQIKCSIELGPTNTKLKEYGARYSDGHVETFIAVPDTDVPFTIHVKSDGYIAPGLAVFVFMDGEYQCNRNRVSLKLPAEDVEPQEYEAEFRLRRKEEKLETGSFVVREWSFAKLDRVAADKAPSLNPQFLNNIGTIEIVVLRCKTDFDDAKPMKVPHSTPPVEKPSAHKSRPRHKPASVITAEKILATPPPSESGGLLGGMFGLFDGAADDPVTAKGRVRPEPPPGMEYDSVFGGFKPAYETFQPEKPVNVGQDFRPEIVEQAKTVEAGKNHQLDGHDGQPAVVINQWGGRGRDDMRGDAYLGMAGTQRAQYKDHLRTTGLPVSDSGSLLLIGNNSGYQERLRGVLEGRCAYEKTKKGMDQWLADLRQYEEMVRGQDPNMAQGFWKQLRELEALFDRLYGGQMRTQGQFTAQHQAARHDWYTYVPGQGRFRDDSGSEAPRPRPLDAIKMVTSEGIVGFEKFPDSLNEPLKDIEIMRKTLIQLRAQHPDLLLELEMERLGELQLDRLQNPIFRPKCAPHTVEGNAELLRSLEVCYADLETFYHQMRSYDDKLPMELLSARLQFLGSVQKRILQKQTELLKVQFAKEMQDKGLHVNPQGHGWGDATYNGFPRPNFGYPQVTQGGDYPGLQQVGGGTWNPQHKQPNQGGYGLPLGWQQFQPNTLYAGVQKGKDGGARSMDNWNNDQEHTQDVKSNSGWREEPPTQFNNTWGKANDNDGNAKDNPWENSGSGKTPEHNFSQQGNQNADPWATPANGSNRGDVENNWGDNNKAGDDNWGGNSNAGNENWRDDNNAGNGNWGGNNDANNDKWAQKSKDTQQGAWNQSQQNRQGSQTHSVHTLKSEGPENYIKSYWKDWNTPAKDDERRTKAEKKPKQPRIVKTYPGLPPPAIPSDRAKHASHLIQKGEGVDYAHLCRRPTYLDSMESPYAVFSFKYRSKDILEKILKTSIADLDTKPIKEKFDNDRYMNMPKHKLVGELMKKRVPSGGNSNGKASPAASKAGRGWGSPKAGNGSVKDGWGSGSKTGNGGGWNQGDTGGGGNAWGSGSKANGGDGWNQSNAGGGGNDGWGSGQKSNGGNGSKANGGAGWEQGKGGGDGGRPGSNHGNQKANEHNFGQNGNAIIDGFGDDINNPNAGSWGIRSAAGNSWRDGAADNAGCDGQFENEHPGLANYPGFATHPGFATAPADIWKPSKVPTDVANLLAEDGSDAFERF